MANKEISFNDFTAGLETVTDENGNAGIVYYSFDGKHETEMFMPYQTLPVGVANALVNVVGTFWQVSFYAGIAIGYLRYKLLDR